jgi:polyferredoxin
MKTLTKRDLRIFALVLTIILGFLSSKFSKGGNLTLSGSLLLFSIATFIIALSAPVLIMPLYKTLSFLGKIIGGVITTLLLSIIFYCVFTPIGVILRITNKDLLGLRIEKTKDSYWTNRDPKAPERQSMERQY